MAIQLDRSSDLSLKGSYQLKRCQCDLILRFWAYDLHSVLEFNQPYLRLKSHQKKMIEEIAMSTKGFIKLDRDIDQHWVFQRDPEFRIWIYLILKSQFSNQKKPVMIGNKERTLQRGEILTTIERIAGDLNLNPRVVRRCLDLFKKNDMIVKTTGRGKGIP